MLAAALTMAWAQVTAAQNKPGSTEYSLTIPSGSLTTALDQFSKQTGLQIAAELKTPELQQHPVDAVNGRFTANAALEQLLAGSNLTYSWADDSTIRIYVGIVPPEGEGGQREVQVTGTRLGGGEGPAPVRVYGREQIERLGISTLPGLATYFPQQPFSSAEWTQRSAAQHFQMRGLGVDTTLVLINGRRAPPSATSVSLNAFDLNTIPLTAVERIEVMSDSASAIYGSDAIGGVINIIMRQDVTAPDIYLHYGGAAGGADERRIAGSIGTSGERFKSALTLDYFDRSMLVGAERDLWRNQDYRRFGGNDYRRTAAPRANIYSLTGAPLPGLPTSQASVPVGSTGVGLRPEDFLATAGEVSLYSGLKTASVAPDVRRISAVGSAELSMGERSTIFGEMLLSTSDIEVQGSPSPLVGIVSAENPFNPFRQPVRVDFSAAGTKPVSQLTEEQSTRFVLGARGELGRWNWEVALINSDDRANVVKVNELDLALVHSALQSTDPQMALNPFADGRAGSDALLASLAHDQESDYLSRASLLSGFLRRPLFRMPGGMSELVMGGELRREEVKAVDTTPLEQERDIISEFAEIKLPLLKQLSLKLALRSDSYEEADDSMNPQYGLVWRPSQDWLVRAAYGTSFRPPSLAEVSFPRSEVLFSLSDPLRGGSVSPVMVTFGGNQALENVSAHSFTTGVSYRVSGGPGLHWGAHYWRVVMDNRIVVPNLSNLEKLEELSGRVTRSDPTPADRSEGWPGALKSVDISLLNYGQLETSGIDLDLAYRAASRFGQTQAALAATWVDKYSSQDMTLIDSLDRVGIANFQGTVPEWRLIGSLTLEGHGWGISTMTTFTPSYQDSGPTGSLDRRLPSRTIVDVQASFDVGRLLKTDFCDGLKVTAGALNVFDKDVDFANAGISFGFDVSQADLKQRFVYLRITKDFW